MSKYSNFQSLSAINSQREETREARRQILEKAKRKYEAEERKKEMAKQEGEGTWMLDSVSKRINKEQRAQEKAKKKEKKKKKKKKSKKRSDSSSSSSAESDGEVWVQSKNSGQSSTTTSEMVKGPKLQRDSWMEAPVDLIPYFSRQDIRDAAKKEKEEARKESERMLEPGQHVKELNPYWKNGGTGVPMEKTKTKPSSSPTVAAGTQGDGGLSWLRKAYQRCKEEAEEEGKSLEEVAAERWGSLKRLKSMLEDAERKQRALKEGMNESSDRSNDRWRENRRNDDRRKERDWESNDRSGSDHGWREKERRGRSQERDDRSQDYHGQDKYERSHESRRDRRGDEDRKSNVREENERENYRRGRENDRQRSDHSDRRLAFRRPDSDEEGGGGSRGASRGFMKPSEDSERGSPRRAKQFVKPDASWSTTSSSERKFKREGDLDLEAWGETPGTRSPLSSSSSAHSRHEVQQKAADVPRWKRKQLKAEPVRDDNKDEEKMEQNKVRSKRTPSTSSSSSLSESGSSDVDEGKEEEGKMQGSGSSAKILSEEELNALAAKILRAEIMGEETLASELKTKLEEARSLRESAKAGEGGGPDFSYSRMEARGRNKKEEEEDDNVVVLSRTSKGGMVRPVLGSAEGMSGGGGKRKRKNVATHGDDGERNKYFHDDDRFDLKTLVEREKAGTAEDQNSMFARLAGRAGDHDLDVDDMFVSKAAKKQDTEQACSRDKMSAIFEHRKIQSAMDKCHRCFDKVPKHLIIAIGSKSYLCLPVHRSLTDGHCLIVPMSHVSSATNLDEDVWQEMQLFRKSLVQMFKSQDQDVVVMETVMHLKHFPHTAIECVPLDREVGDLAPIYFKKAIQEVGPEWSDNKKVHDLSKKDVRHVIPKGFPYFSVDFGLQGGFAHVIEDEHSFPSYFGREIVGGMLDTEPSLWRKPHKQSFEDQRQKVLQFEQWWSPFDWTRDLNDEG